MELGFLILIVSGIPDSLGCTPDSKLRIPYFTSKNIPDPRFKDQKFIGFRNPDFLLHGTISIGSVYWKKVRVNELDAPVQRAGLDEVNAMF